MPAQPNKTPTTKHVAYNEKKNPKQAVNNVSSQRNSQINNQWSINLTLGSPTSGLSIGAPGFKTPPLYPVPIDTVNYNTYQSLNSVINNQNQYFSTAPTYSTPWVAIPQYGIYHIDAQVEIFGDSSGDPVPHNTFMQAQIVLNGSQIGAGGNQLISGGTFYMPASEGVIAAAVSGEYLLNPGDHVGFVMEALSSSTWAPYFPAFVANSGNWFNIRYLGSA